LGKTKSVIRIKKEGWVKSSLSKKKVLGNERKGWVDRCPNQKNNLAECNCSYEPCSRKGICCSCIAYHRKSRQLPACFFSEESEKTFDRSFANFIRENK
jgi:hypothetical protein